MGIFKEAAQINEFDADLFFKLVEKITVLDEDLLIVSLIDVTEIGGELNRSKISYGHDILKELHLDDDLQQLLQIREKYATKSDALVTKYYYTEDIVSRSS